MLCQTVAAVVFLSSLAPQIADVQEKRRDQSPPTNNQSEASSHVSAIAKQASREGQNKNQNESPPKNAVLAWCKRYEVLINLVCAICVAAFTGILTLYTVKLWTAGERHSERELRAYVFPVEVEARNFGPEQVMETFVKVKNTGQTPAYGYQCVIHTKAGKFPQKDFTFSWDEAGAVPSFLGPGESHWFIAQVDKKLSKERFTEIVNGTGAVYTFGEIHYVDAFKKKRFTKFRTIARGQNGAMITGRTPEIIKFQNDTEGNEAD